ncbi:kinase-like domain-containing protein [Chytriomyces sp. MP71]|nr:kinase-like domain-containing protein [Chytriomyces sp. MP71]
MKNRALSFLRTESAGNLKLPSTFSSQIKDYELVIDIGGVSDVSYLYLAKHVPTEEMVALSYTDLTLSPNFEFLDEMIRTIQNSRQCLHKNILPYFTSFIENERLWSVTLPVATGSCRGIMKDHFPNGFDEAVVATILREVLNAVIYLHENHMIHNDLRADNILLDMKGNVRVTGLRQMVTLLQNGGYVKNVFSILSDNIEWAAPEIMAQNSNFDEKVDIYSFGITAMELAYGRTPFDDWAPLKILLSKLEYDCPAIQTTKLMPKSFLKMVRACIRKDPKERPTARELLLHPFFNYAKSTEYLYGTVVTYVKAQKRELDLELRNELKIGFMQEPKLNL